MFNPAALLPGFAAKPISQVLEELMESVHAFWVDNRLKTKHAVGATQRLLRVQKRFDVLLERLRAGAIKPWRKRPPRVVAAAPVDVDVQAGDPPPEPREPGARRRRFGLPVYHGWLGRQMPLVAAMSGSDLEQALRSDEMQALMRLTPEVARIGRPVLRMMGLDESMLAVPEGYDAGAARNRPPRQGPEPKPVDPDAYVAPLVVPEGYDEARDGRKPHPLRDPHWRYWVYENYRSYLYYYMNRRPPLPSPR